jgi:predicted phosphohydrolase
MEEILELQENVDLLQLQGEAKAKEFDEEEESALSGMEDDNRRRLQDRLQMEASLLHRRLAPPPYDSTRSECPDPNKIRSFKTAPRLGHGKTKVAVIGDIGQFPHSEEVLDHLRRHHADVDTIILAGDLAYPEMDHRRWDTFMDFFDDYPLIENVPMHITAGNHDIDKPSNGNQIFAAYETRFRMPRIKAAQLGTYDGPLGPLNMDRPPYPLDYEYGNAYYAFQYGKTHQIFINSYSAMEPGSKQYEWLVQELESVDRNETPWLLVTYHVPIYNTFEVHQRDFQLFKTREFIEPLLVKYKVNLVFNGHIHAYLRTKPVAFGNVSKTGPVHIVMGAGGRAAKADFLHDEPEEWVEIRDATIYGYGLLDICNKTHARWDWVHTGQEGDHNVVYKENVILPPGGVDHTYFVNQYFLDE